MHKLKDENPIYTKSMIITTYETLEIQRYLPLFHQLKLVTDIGMSSSAVERCRNCNDSFLCTHGSVEVISRVVGN